jgi:hypothetical protein
MDFNVICSVKPFILFVFLLIRDYVEEPAFNC